MNRRTVVRLGALLILAALLWGVWMLVGSYWSPILFWGYLLVALLVFVSGTLGMIAGLRRTDPTDPLRIRYHLMMARLGNSRLQVFRHYALIVISNLSAALAWPATAAASGVLMVRHGIHEKKFGSGEFAATVNLHTPYALLCGVTAAMVVALVVVSVAFGTTPGPERQVTLLLLAVSVVLRHLAFLIDFHSLPTLLRRSAGDPKASFILVGVADLTTLILTFAAFSAWGADQPVQFADVRTAGVNTVLLAKLWPAITDGKPITGLELLACCAGGLFILNGFKSLARFTDFLTPTTEDVHAIAQSQLALRNYREARKALNSIPAHKREPATYELFAYVELATDHLDEARLAAANCVEELKLDPAVRDAEMLRILITAAVSLQIEREQVIRYFSHWVATATHDLYLALGVEGYIRSQITAIQQLPEDQRADEAGRFFDALEGAFPPGDARKRHGLSYAVLLMTLELHDAVRAVLAEYTPTSPAEELFEVGLVYLSVLRTGIQTNPVAPVEPIRETLRELEATHAAELAKKVKLLKTDDERFAVLDRLYVVCDHAEVMEAPHTAYLTQLTKALLDDFGGVQRVEQLLLASQAVRPGRQEQLRGYLQALRLAAAAAAVAAGAALPPPGPPEGDPAP
jgi:hypothetical protein